MHKLTPCILTLSLVACTQHTHEQNVSPPPQPILLHSRDATVHGTTLRYEPEPHKNTLGFWTNEADYAAWDFVADSGGTFEVEILQGCGTDQGGSTVEVTVAGQSLMFTVQDTGHFQNFVARVIGRVHLSKGTHTLTVRPIKKAHNAVMDLRQVRLTPTVR